MLRKILYISPLLVLLAACNNTDKLPVYGPKTAVTKNIDGKTVTDSLDYTIPAFSFVDQDSNTITESVAKDKVFVADYFFTSCPSICPKMMQQMLRLSEKFKGNPDVVFLSFSIDPTRDTVQKLHTYAQKLDIETAKWHLLTGQKDSIYSLAEKMLVSAGEDPDAPGGHVHSGNFILIDKQKRLRGYYDGTDEKSVDKLMVELEELLHEK
ncbi:MAG: SCO family protein [Chitinophagales bacterium]